MFTRRLLLLSLVAICAINLAGCATTDGYEWTRSTRPSLPYIWQVSTAAEVQVECKGRANFTVHACASYYPKTCLIIAQTPEANTPRWIADHEIRHCEGWDHEQR